MHQATTNASGDVMLIGCTLDFCSLTLLEQSQIKTNGQLLIT